MNYFNIQIWSIFMVFSFTYAVQLEEAGKQQDNISSRIIGIDPAAFATIGEKRYYISPTINLVTVVEAMAFCNDVSMALLSLETQAENILINEFLNANGFSGVGYWTSGRKVADRWQWSGTGQLMGPTKWAPGYPNYTGPGDPCVVMDSTNGWFDYECSTVSQHRFICE